MTEPVPCNFEKALDLGTFTMKPCRNLGLKTFLGNLYLETLEAVEISPGPLPGETFTWLGTLEILRLWELCWNLLAVIFIAKVCGNPVGIRTM